MVSIDVNRISVCLSGSALSAGGVIWAVRCISVRQFHHLVDEPHCIGFCLDDSPIDFRFVLGSDPIFSAYVVICRACEYVRLVLYFQCCAFFAQPFFAWGAILLTFCMLVG